MNQEFDPGRVVYIDRDPRGTVAQLRHLDRPYVSRARTPQLVAADYLHEFRDLLEIPEATLANLGATPSAEPGASGVEFRFVTEKHQQDLTTVGFSQTVLGLPIFHAGVSVQIKGDGTVLSSHSTQHPDVKIARPDDGSLKRAESLTPTRLAHALGLASAKNGEAAAIRKSLEIERLELVVYQYDPDAVQRDGEPVFEPLGIAAANGHDVAPPSNDFGGGIPRLSLPNVPDSIRPGDHYVCVKVDFTLSVPNWEKVHWTALLEVDTLAVLYARPHVDDVTGMVFDVDPITTNGAPGPSATTAQLNPIRVSRTLVGLNAPVNNTVSLAGDTVTLSDVEQPTVAAPTEPTGTSFDFDSRTDNFSAVNAYYHTDSFFRLVDSMGFGSSAYFPGTTFPTPVDHRGAINTTNGIEVNAHCLGTTGGAGILQTTFALADTGDTTHPIGIADDYRVVLHELGGHGVLYNHLHSANFPFAHSAGDSIACILNDPGTQAPDRFVTFPWVNIGRRHDRTPAGGWGWSGDIGIHPFDSVKDRFGYNNEQILSSTMFRIYRSLGGDSTDLNTQRFAARMTIYLILKTIGSLSFSSPPANAAAFEAAMETADSTDWISENITGGAYRKVIRWSFEKQGLFQSTGAATPNNNAGNPPAVDVYIDDGRSGEYQYQSVFWNNQNIWNRRHADGGTTHEDPITNQPNFAYVRIRNRGTQLATGVNVQAFHANPAAGLLYPNDWIPMTTASLPASNVPANSGGDVIVGPFTWTPTHVGHECMFMIVTATGDDSNASHIAAGDAIPEWRLVPHDNNIGQRNVAPVPGGTTGLTDEFNGLTFEMKNPLLSKAVMRVEHTLPALLEERGWRLEFTNRGGAAFTLESGESREIVMRLVPGKEFGPDDVRAVSDRTITVAARADGILVGGMSYELDPTITRPNRPGQTGGGNPGPGEPGHVHDEHCGCRMDAKLGRMSELLLKALERRPQRVREVEIKKVLVEIELEDDC